MWASRSRSWSRTTAIWPRTPPPWSRSITSRCRRPPIAATRRSPVRRRCAASSAQTSSPVYRVAYGDAEAAFRKAAHVLRENFLAASRRRASDRGPRHRGRMPQRPTDRSPSGPRPRRRMTCSTRSPRCSVSTRVALAGRDARCRRRLRSQALRLSGGRRGRRGGETCSSARSNGSRTGASISLNAAQERDQYWSIEIAVDAAGPHARHSRHACCTISAPMRCRTSTCPTTPPPR